MQARLEHNLVLADMLNKKSSLKNQTCFGNLGAIIGMVYLRPSGRTVVQRVKEVYGGLWRRKVKINTVSEYKPIFFLKSNIMRI